MLSQVNNVSEGSWGTINSFSEEEESMSGESKGWRGSLGQIPKVSVLTMECGLYIVFKVVAEVKASE